jgi:hypothetical protein
MFGTYSQERDEAMVRIGILLALLTPYSSIRLLQYAASRSLESKGADIIYRVGQDDARRESDHLYSHVDGKWLPYRVRGPLIDFAYPVVKVQMHKSASDDDVRLLSYMLQLRELNLAYCFNISDEAVKYLTTLPNLQVLYLYRNDPTEHNNFTRGTIDLLSQPRITDKSLEYLSTMKSLRKLYLWDNDFSDLGVTQLQKLKRLEILEFRSPKISPEAIRALRMALPTTSIDDGR